MKRKAFTLIELLVVIAIIAILAAILFPVFAQAKKAAKKAASAQNNRQMALAGVMYGGDFDDAIPVMVNGTWRNLRNVRDGDLTQYNEQRTDGWPLLLAPYIKSLGLYVDPGRGDVPGVWRGPALASADAGYVATKNTYRNQSRDSMYGINYLFLSPLLIPSNKMGDTTPTDFMSGESHTFTEADDPSGTIFYTESQFGYLSTDNLVADFKGQLENAHGFFGVNAPGLWNVLASSSVPYVVFWNGTDCSGDWCGDFDPATTGRQKETNSVSILYNDGANATFLDGHVKYMKDNALAAGTNYLSATPNSIVPAANGGGATITDKNAYLWNLKDFYYGA